MNAMPSISHSLMVAGMVWLTAWAPVAQSSDTTSAATPPYRVLFHFSPSKPAGEQPQAPLLQAPDGYFYGTTTTGGKYNNGTIFRMDPSQRGLKVLYSFEDPNRVNSWTGLTLGPDGALYGLTGGGGKYNGGMAYKITTTGQFTVLHSFSGSPKDGLRPEKGAMVFAPDGYFYGTTSGGGRSAYGTAFKMTPDGQVTVLHNFSPFRKEGADPHGQLTLASDGNFYGTTPMWGAGDGGTLYRMTPNGDVSVVVSFSNAGSSPHYPEAAPTQGADGFLYGTTWTGGAYGFGTVYKVSLDGTSYTTLHDFASGSYGDNAADGARPMGQLLMAGDGNLYGTCNSGGDMRTYSSGAGTVFRVLATGAYETVKRFGAGQRDGAQPFSALTLGADGWLYGTTITAGTGWGTLFKLALP